MTVSQLGNVRAAAPPAAVRARDLIRSEWTKLRSVRANLWTLVIAALVTIGLTAVIAHTMAAAPVPPDRGPITPLIESFLGYAEYTVLPVSILGVLTFTSEYSTGLIRTTLVAVPRRWALLAAKAAAAGGAALAAGEVLAFALFFLTQGLQSAHRPGGLSIAHPGVPGAVLAAGFLLPACVLTGLGLGAILRHTASAIAATVGVIYLLAALCLLLPSPWKLDIGRFTLPFAAYQVVSLQPQPHLLGPAGSVVVLIAWPAVTLAAAAIVISRRDV
jgi:ABC-2 type transport system permease protein